MHEALRQARGAGAVHHVERVVEWQPLEAQGRIRAARDEVAPRHGGRDTRDCLSARLVVTEEGDEDHLAQARKRRRDLLHARHGVDALAGVAISICRDEHDGFDLPEPVEDAVQTEIRRAGRPDRADRRGRERADDRLGDVGQEADDAVTRLHAERAQGTRRLPDLVGECREGDLAAAAALVTRDDRNALVTPPEQVLREVEPGAREPPGTPVGRGRRHRLPADEHLVPRLRAGAFVGDDMTAAPDRRPESGRFTHRPFVPLRVCRLRPRRRGVPGRDHAEEGRHRAPRGAGGIGAPEGRVGGGVGHDARI